MPILLAAVAGLGLAVGSFLNVVIYRLPRRLSLVRPPSQCPTCHRPIRNRHNVPVFGWLLLRGRCADCSTPISARYPLVELATGSLFVIITLRLAHLHRLPALPAFLWFTAIGISLTLIDIDVHRLPNAIVLPSYPILGALLCIAGFVQHDYSALSRAAVCGAALFALYVALRLAYPQGMGFGDVKLAGVVGMMLGYLSYSAALVGGFGAFLIGGVAGAAVIASRRGSRKSQLPFGPFMLIAALLATLAGAPLADLYTRLLLSS
jgi:leader peptidase (prepilin peptidase) / N-methyltransferase